MDSWGDGPIRLGRASPPASSACVGGKNHFSYFALSLGLALRPHRPVYLRLAGGGGAVRGTGGGDGGWQGSAWGQTQQLCQEPPLLGIPQGRGSSPDVPRGPCSLKTRRGPSAHPDPQPRQLSRPRLPELWGVLGRGRVCPQSAFLPRCLLSTYCGRKWQVCCVVARAVETEECGVYSPGAGKRKRSFIHSINTCVL